MKTNHTLDLVHLRKGRPPIDRELAVLQKRLATIDAGLLACYETIAIGQQKKAAIEAAIKAHNPPQADAAK